jgi:zinc D-Ala-D-Ala carboxypeptidase
MGDLTRNFSHSEVACKCGHCKGAAKISPDLMGRLQQMRDAVGPIRITSGVRCRKHPESRTRPTSSHVPNDLGDIEGKVGHAVDIAAVGSGRRFRLLHAALAAGFVRVGIGKTFLHLDNDQGKAQGVAWDYYPK